MRAIINEKRINQRKKCVCAKPKVVIPAVVIRTVQTKEKKKNKTEKIIIKIKINKNQSEMKME